MIKTALSLSLALLLAPFPAGATPTPDTESADEETDEMTVVAEASELKRIAGSAHVIDNEQMELFEYDDIHRVLAQIPGVYVREEDGFGLRPNIGLRGASSDRSSKVTLMEDGLLLGPAPYSAPAAYYFPLMTRMTGTEVFKGPAAIQHGPSTIGGALNLLTVPIPEGSLLSMDLAGGQYRSGKGHTRIGYGGRNFGFLLEGVHLRTDGFKELDTGDTTGFIKNEGMLKLAYRSSPSSAVTHRVMLKLGAATELSNETYMGLSNDDFEATPYRRYSASQNALMDWKRTQAALTWFVGLSERLDISTNLYRNDFRRAWTKMAGFDNSAGRDLKALLQSDLKSGTPQTLYRILTGEADSSAASGGGLLIGTNDRTFVSQGIQSTLHWRPNWDIVEQDIELGVRFHNDSIERNPSQELHHMEGGVLTGAGSEETLAQNRGETHALALHLRDELRRGSLVVSPGLRFEHITTTYKKNGDTAERSYSVLVPGAGIFYELSENIGLLAGVYRGFSPLAPGPEASDDAEPKPETSVNYEAGARLQGEDSELELVGFFNDYENITATCRLSSSGKCANQYGRQFNGGQAWVYGLEFAASHRQALPARMQLGLRLAYTLTRTQFRTSFQSAFDQYGNVAAGDNLPYVPRHQANLGLGLNGQGFADHQWSVDLSTTWVSQMRDVAGQGTLAHNERIPEHTVLDLVTTYGFSPQSNLYLKVDNLLNQAYMVSRRPYGPRPGKPLLVMLGYKHQFSDLW
jgi:Fe(3+) dicitrate transport protein